MTISIQTEGRRTYITGNTYHVRDRIRALGAHWDAARKMWWTGKREEAETLVAQLTQSQPAQSSGSKTPRDGVDSVVAGRVEHKGKTYYLAGRQIHGRTHWDDGVEPVTTSDGAKYLLYFRDGASQFWAPRGEVRIVKAYDRPQTIRRLQKFAEEAKAAQAAGADVHEYRAEKSGRCRGCGGELRDAAHHRAMGGYCGSCAFDEYDM